MSKNEKIKRSLLIIVILLIVCFSIVLLKGRKTKVNNGHNEKYDLVGNYNVDLIKKFHEQEEGNNYLISPYNIEIALNMLRDGADGKTKEELDEVLGNREINDVRVKDKIGIANGVFIKEDYKNDVKQDYYNILKTKYNSEVIYDKFASPDKINNWVKEKTNGMIDKILDKVNSDFVMGLASALAIDVKWLNSFECTSTTSEQFTKLNNEKMNTEMMHKTIDDEDYKYFTGDDAEGIIIPYQKEKDSNVQLEFVGILPKDISSFIKDLTKEKLDNLDKERKAASNNLHINLSLPRFKYDYNAEKFIDILKAIGIREAFDQDNANFKKMIEIDENVYVGEAVHKTHIEFNEVGTKAAAITYFGMFRATSVMPQEVEEINIKFNKPFIYMIREANTKEILFFGTVYEPNAWHGSTCDK